MEEELKEEKFIKRNIKELKCETSRVQEGLPDVEGSLESKMAVKSEDSYLVAWAEKGIVLYENGKLIYKNFGPGNILADQKEFELVYLKSMDFYVILVDKKIYKKRIDGLAPSLCFDSKVYNFEPFSLEVAPNCVHRVLLIGSMRRIFQLNLKTKKIEFLYSTEIDDCQPALLYYSQIHGPNWKILSDVNSSEEVKSAIMTQLTSDERLVTICLLRRKILKSNKLENLSNKIHDYEEPAYFDYQSFCVCAKNRYLCLRLVISSEVNDYPTLVIFELGEVYEISYVAHKTSIPFSFSQRWDYLSGLEAVGYFEEERVLFVGLVNHWTSDDNVLFFEFNVRRSELGMVSSLKTSLRLRKVARMIRHGSYFYYSGVKGEVMRFKLVWG